MDIQKSKNYPWILVACYSLLGLCMPAAVTQFSMLVDTMAGIMEVSSQTILLADSLRAVCLVCGMLLSGAVHQKLGLKKTIMLGLCFQILPQFLVPLALDMRSLPFFYIAKGLQGLNAVAFPLYLSTIAAWVDSRHRGLAVAVFNGSFTAGAGVGAWIAGMVIPAFGWRISFYFVGLMCLIFAIPALLITRTPPLTAEEQPLKTTAKAPAGQYLRVLKVPATWLLVASMLACTWVMQAVTVDMSVYAASIGYNYGQTGNLMLLISISAVVFSILGGFVSDYAAFKARRTILARCLTMAGGYAITIVAAALLPTAAPLGFGGLMAAAVAMMAGVAWVQGGFWAIPGDIYSPADNIVATAICSGASNIVNPVAPMVVGVLLGTKGLWGAAWMTCSAISVVSILAAVLLPRLAAARRAAPAPSAPKQQSCQISTPAEQTVSNS